MSELGEQVSEEQIAVEAKETLRIASMLCQLAKTPAWIEVRKILLAERQQRMKDIVDTNFFEMDGDASMSFHRFGILQGSVRTLNMLIEMPQKALILLRDHEDIRRAMEEEENGTGSRE